MIAPAPRAIPGFVLGRSTAGYFEKLTETSVVRSQRLGERLALQGPGRRDSVEGEAPAEPFENFSICPG